MQNTLHHPLARALSLSSRLPRFSRQAAAILAAATLLSASAGLRAQDAEPLPDVEVSQDVELLQIAGQGPGDQILTWVDRALTANKNRHLDIQVNTPWQILHGLLAMRESYQLRNGSKMISAMDWISTEARFKGESWFIKAPDGGLAHPYNGTPYDFEGHVNQTLSIIAMCNVPREHKFVTETGETVTMQELIDYAKLHCSTKVETTWTLWFLTAYLDQDEEWTNVDGEPWSMEYLVKLQVNSSHQRAPCGGCHSLFALAFARNSYMKKHGQLRGAWLEADQKLEKYVASARAMQNRDGSFATGFFNERGLSQDFNERIKSSGHMLEWLMLTLPQKRLEEQWVRQGVQCLASDLIRNSQQPADCGPLYHSIHALNLYKQRMTPVTTPAPQAAPLVKAPAEENVPQPAPGPVVLRAPDGESMPNHPHESQARIAEKPTAPVVEKLPAIVQKPAVVAEKPAVHASKPQDKPLTIPAPALNPPVRISEEPSNVRRLGAENTEGSADQAVQPAAPLSAPIAAEPLTPVPGAMPILKAPDAPQAESK